MANRPVFLATNNNELVEEMNIDFQFFNGFSVSQKTKSIISLHKAFSTQSLKKVLEVSTKSDSKLGWALSAFNLQVDFEEGRTISMECAFQGSKVFENGMQYSDLYFVESIKAKKDMRIRTSGNLTYFLYDGQKWELEPKTAFYDWLYMKALYQHHPDIINQLLKYDAFTDIEFNPKRSINCQARTCAMLVSLLRINKLEEALLSKENFIKIAYPSLPRQGTLF